MCFTSNISFWIRAVRLCPFHNSSVVSHVWVCPRLDLSSSSSGPWCLSISLRISSSNLPGLNGSIWVKQERLVLQPRLFLPACAWASALLADRWSSSALRQIVQDARFHALDASLTSGTGKNALISSWSSWLQTAWLWAAVHRQFEHKCVLMFGKMSLSTKAAFNWSKIL